MDYRPPGSSVHGILQERILEWKAIPFSRGSSRPRQGLDPGIKPKSPALQVEPARVVDTHTHTHTHARGFLEGILEMLESRSCWEVGQAGIGWPGGEAVRSFLSPMNCLTMYIYKVSRSYLGDRITGHFFVFSSALVFWGDNAAGVVF